MARLLARRGKDLAAVVGLLGVALAIGLFIVQEQRLRVPLLEEQPFVVKAEFPTAQAVVPGQGQTVRVAGVRVGDIRSTSVEDGRAVITMELDQEFRDLVREDASAFLRPRTGLKDMFVELDPGTKAAKVADEGWTLPISSTLPDVNPDEVLAGLDADVRDHLKLLVNGAGQGLEGRADDLRDVLKRFEPTYRDLALVTGEVSKRRAELKRLIRSLNLLNTELASKDEDLAELVASSSKVFRQFAAERDSVEGIARELPGALERTRSAMSEVRDLARVLRPAADELRPVARSLRGANEAVRPFAKEAAPLLREQVRPFVRAARPTVRTLRPVADGLAKGEPGLTRSFKVLNHLFNMLGSNPEGREDPAKRGRDEGFLFALAWLGHQSVNLFANADAHGPMRAITLGGTCQTILGTVQAVPQIEQLLGLSGVLTDTRLCGGIDLDQRVTRTSVSGKGR
ncbi:MlaD family protein [Conexibacter sp. SYSU D00693]|uniref:MlaD family protein n=1 Tax=Conexibacter sp. SYSU D00693 TaxID=2812560 RepID=UPI00196A98C2|nr:MlaD family protein [Conexibacter sp. SYSU D00693]